MHAGKSRVYRARDGITFLGWRVFPDHMRLGRANVTRFRRRLAMLHCNYAYGRIGIEDVRARLLAWIAHAAHGDPWQFAGVSCGI